MHPIISPKFKLVNTFIQFSSRYFTFYLYTRALFVAIMQKIPHSLDLQPAVCYNIMNNYEKTLLSHDRLELL